MYIHIFLQVLFIKTCREPVLLQNPKRVPTTASSAFSDRWRASAVRCFLWAAPSYQRSSGYITRQSLSPLISIPAPVYLASLLMTKMTFITIPLPRDLQTSGWSCSRAELCGRAAFCMPGSQRDSCESWTGCCCASAWKGLRRLVFTKRPTPLLKKQSTHDSRILTKSENVYMRNPSRSVRSDPRSADTRWPPDRPSSSSHRR